LRSTFAAQYSKRLGVIVSDSFGRPWRRGTVGIALGSAGVPALMDLRGKPDLHGRPLQFTETGFADEVAAAASLLMGQADEGQPAVLVSGFALTDAPIAARALLRPTSEDLFR
jgi:coenzyme F420-0:L-glutamate ligase/coenzyme F420-1:gamma-L-glutamate ligase